MSKLKYFAKWLPVEGEIKVGDYYLHEDGSVMKWGKLTGDPKKWKGFQKTKMFLCSRDIKLGDKYYHDSFHPYPTGDIADTNTKVMNAHMMVTNEGPNYEGDWSYKVIGEISPDALPYVKKGQEFGEDEVDLSRTAWIGYLEKYTPIYRIKCNMNHFH